MTVFTLFSLVAITSNPDAVFALDRNLSDARICDLATARDDGFFKPTRWSTYTEAVQEAKRRGLGCGVEPSREEREKIEAEKRK